MGYAPRDFIGLKDGPNLDAFGRLRVSVGETLFDSQQEYGPSSLYAENFTAGTATATHSITTGSTVLSTAATTSANRAMRQSKVYWRYQPGKSQLVKMTGVLAKSGTPTGAAVARIGYFDDRNGIFFGYDVTGFFVCRRTDTSGSVVDNKVYQSNWNLDKVDGTGPSGIIADFTKAEIFLIDLQWLGVGRVRLAIQSGGATIYVHEFLNANVISGLYMRTANLPVRAEVFNDGGTGSNISLETFCTSIESEGGLENEGGYTFAATTDGTAISLPNSATLTPILSIRLRDTFNGLTYRGHCHPLNIILSVASQPIYWQLVWNATLTGANFVDVDTTYSGVQQDVSATAYTGGTVLQVGYEASGAGVNRQVNSSDLLNRLILARTYANARDTLTLVARGLGGAATAYAAINFEEQY